jgi:tetratricopeptide (TPR) repeat protein
VGCWRRARGYPAQGHLHAHSCDYLRRAAGRAGRAAAHREETALLAHAIRLAEGLQQGELVADLHAQRGRAFWSVGQWRDAMGEFQAALAGVPADRPERQAETHVELAWAAAHAYDTPVARRHASAGLALAAGRARPDLTTHATGVLGLSDSADGDLDGAMRRLEDATERATALGLHLPPRAPTWHALMLYWTGRLHEAAERGGDAVRAARGLNDLSGTMLALMVAGISLAAGGRYAEAVRSFAEASRLGREHGAESLAARNAAFTIGLHLDVYDYRGVEARAAEAREFGRSSNHGPCVFNSTIDLLFAFARTQRAGEAEALVPEVLAGIAATGGWHH